MNALPDCSNCTVLPEPESNWLEFKQSFAALEHGKLLKTVCAFLNASGGYIVIGVTDEDRNINGISLNKNYDRFLLEVDAITGRSRILRNDGTPLPRDTITISTLKTIHQKTLCVVTVKPEPSYRYHLSDGSSYIRLQASNYKQPSSATVYSHEQYTTMIRNKEDQINKLAQTIKSQYSDVISKAKEIETTYTTLIKEAHEHLFASILKQKEIAEKHLAASKGFLSFLC